MIIIAKLRLNVIYYGYFVQITTLIILTRLCVSSSLPKHARQSAVSAGKTKSGMTVGKHSNITLRDYFIKSNCLGFGEKTFRQHEQISMVSDVSACYVNNVTGLYT